MTELNWQREPPDEPGHWVWVKFEGGKILESGICSVLVGEGRPSASAMAWAKIDLPSQGFLEGE